MSDTRFFYIIKTIGTHYKTGIAEDVERRLRTYRTVAPMAVIVGTWLCPMDTAQERTAQYRMRAHSSCTWAGGETFDVQDETAFLAELRSIFGEPQTLPLYEFSKMKWAQLQDGSFILSIYPYEKLHIMVNELNEYTLSIIESNKVRPLGVFKSLKEAFETAEEVVKRCRPSCIKLLQR